MFEVSQVIVEVILPCNRPLPQTMLLTELQSRYGLQSRKGLYARINALDLVLPKDRKRRSYATEEMVQELDKLDAHLKSGGELKSYIPTTHTEVMIPDDEVTEPPSKDELLQNRVTEPHSEDLLPQQVTLLPKLLSIIENLTSSKDPLLPNRLLKEAADNEYLLNSKQVKEIIGISPRGSIFSRYGYVFTKVGKDGVFSSYRVEKEEE